MKIIITQDQVKLIKESTNKSVGLLKKFYHIEADGSAYRGHNQIQTFVVISPKDWDNPLTPKSTKSFCNWEVVDDEPIHKVMTIPEPSSVPMMEHIGNTDELAEYLAGIHREEAERMIQKLNHRRDNPLNEEESDKPDWLKRNTKVESLLKKLFENKEYDFSFKDKWEDLDGHIETYTFHYHIEILNAIGVGSDTIARVQVIIDDILVDGESVYDDWVDNDYSNDVWYINNLENHLDEEFFDVFPFSIYVNFYGHDEER